MYIDCATVQLYSSKMGNKMLGQWLFCGFNAKTTTRKTKRTKDDCGTQIYMITPVGGIALVTGYMQLAWEYFCLHALCMVSLIVKLSAPFITLCDFCIQRVRRRGPSIFTVFFFFSFLSLSLYFIITIKCDTKNVNSQILFQLHQILK